MLHNFCRKLRVKKSKFSFCLIHIHTNKMNFCYIFNRFSGNKYAAYSQKSSLNLHPQFIQPLHTHRLWGAQLLGEEADAQFF